MLGQTAKKVKTCGKCGRKFTGRCGHGKAKHRSHGSGGAGKPRPYNVYGTTHSWPVGHPFGLSKHITAEQVLTDWCNKRPSTGSGYGTDWRVWPEWKKDMALRYCEQVAWRFNNAAWAWTRCEALAVNDWPRVEVNNGR